MSSVGMTSPLTILVDIIFKKLRRDKVLLLFHLKANALKDCIMTGTVMCASSFSKEGMTKLFVSSGMLDHKILTFPDLYGIVDSFKIDWSKVDGGKNWLLKQLHSYKI